MVLRRDQAVEVIVANVNLGVPSFLAKGPLAKVVSELYSRSIGIAAPPVDVGYRQISGNEAIGEVITSARSSGFNTAGQEGKIAAGVAAINAKGYVFVKRVS